MPRYLLDTNILIDFGRNQAIRTRLENSQVSGVEFVIGPPALIELVRGLVAGGCNTFEDDRRVFVWLRGQQFPILPLPRPFMARVLRTTTRRSGAVEPRHYEQLIEIIADSADFDDFRAMSQAPGSVWNEVERIEAIHEGQLDSELAALGQLARRRRGRDIATLLSQTFGAPGCRPRPVVIARQFSAAIEFLESSLTTVRGGAKPRKNDPGLYVDFQLLFYLADPEIYFLTCEDFSHEIRRMPQRCRIVGLDSLP
jgi:predicted nucleic acid-binding protein